MQVGDFDLSNDLNSTEDDLKDTDYEVESDAPHRKGLRRRRIITKRHKSYLESHHQKGRGRGRPPIHCTPVTCEQCGKSFTLLKHYKRHCVRIYSIFETSVNRLQRFTWRSINLNIHFLSITA